MILIMKSVFTPVRKIIKTKKTPKVFNFWSLKFISSSFLLFAYAHFYSVFIAIVDDGILMPAVFCAATLKYNVVPEGRSLKSTLR